MRKKEDQHIMRKKGDQHMMNWPDAKRLSYDAMYIFHHPGKTYNLIQCVEGFSAGSKGSRQMSKTETTCKGSF